MGSDEKFDDKILRCAECKRDFHWSAEEQAFYSERNFQEPKRCRDCRKKRQHDREAREARSAPDFPRR